MVNHGLFDPVCIILATPSGRGSSLNSDLSLVPKRWFSMTYSPCTSLCISRYSLLLPFIQTSEQNAASVMIPLSDDRTIILSASR